MSPSRPQYFALQILRRQIIVDGIDVRCLRERSGPALACSPRCSCRLGDDCLLLIQELKNTRFIDALLLRAQARAREALLPETDRWMAHIGIDDVVILAVAAKNVNV